ncbi:MAG: Lrp/AsnC family transcriptional regulator [Promethearchaeota archaeon]
MKQDNCKGYAIDDVDRTILEMLQKDSKVKIKDITKVTKKSITAIRTRVRKLEKAFIKKYVAILDIEKIGYKENIMVFIRINASRSLFKVKEEVSRIEEVKYAYIITGEYPLVIYATCLNHGHAMRLIDTLRNLPGVVEIKTQVVLEKVKEDMHVRIP